MKHNYPHVYNMILETPWLITPESLSIILEVIDMRRSGQKFSDLELQARLASVDGAARGRGDVEAGGGVGVLPLYGPIFPKANMMTEMSGATSLQQWSQDFRSLMNNDRVGSIIMDVDSPGGSALGIPEMAKEILAARDVKPIYAVANGGMIGSAALYLSSQATQMFASESSMVGSLGVLLAHTDQSKADENEGVKTTFIHAAKYKVEGNPHEPLSEAGKEYMQEVVDSLYDTFVGAVAEGRGVTAEKVESDFGQGRMLTASKALEVGMVDGIAGLDDVIGELVSGNSLAPAAKVLTTAVAFPFTFALSSTTNASVNYTAGTTNVKFECAEEEHSEPGSGTPPEPRPQEDREQGYPHRFDPLPPGFIPEEAVMNPEQLRALLSAAGIDTTDVADEQLTEEYATGRLSELSAEIQPLREARESAEATNSFRDAYPEEFEQMQKLQERDRKVTATEFAATFSRFTDKDGKETNHGVSALVATQISEAHEKIALKQFTASDLEALLTSMGSGGIVEYGERGSSRVSETQDSGDPKQDFAKLVSDRMTEDKLPYGDALKLVARENPDLFKAYNQASRLAVR